MKEPSLILATDKNGNEITASTVNAWLVSGDKGRLANFFYDRFYGRYIQPFDHSGSYHKNGFTIMANCCLLIETLVSWTEPTFRNTHGNSERCFGYFFRSQKRFQEFGQGGLSLADYLNVGPPKPKLNNTGTPEDFYRNIRCGILHNGEIRNGWKISRAGVLYDPRSKRINAVRFMNRLKGVIKDFRTTLLNSDFDRSKIWKTYKDRLQDLLVNS